MTTYTDKDKVPMIIRPGASFNRTMILKDDSGNLKNLTGFSYFCEIRSKAAGTLIAAMTVVVTAALGRVDFSLTLDQTKEIGKSAGVYDVIEQKDADPQANTHRLFGGTVTVEPTVTAV